MADMSKQLSEIGFSMSLINGNKTQQYFYANGECFQKGKCKFFNAYKRRSVI